MRARKFHKSRAVLAIFPFSFQFFFIPFDFLLYEHSLIISKTRRRERKNGSWQHGEEDKFISERFKFIFMRSIA